MMISVISAKRKDAIYYNVFVFHVMVFRWLLVLAFQRAGAAFLLVL